MSLTDTATNGTNDIRPLEERLAETVGLLNVVTADLVALIGEALRTGAWEGFGIRSPEHWVVWRCGVSPARARRLVAAARALDGLPRVGALFEAGSLTEDQTAVIVRHTDADHDLQVAELAPSLTVPQLARVLPSLPHPDPDPPPNDQPPDDDAGIRATRRAVRFAYGDDGMWWCSIRLPSDEGALVQRALELGRNREFELRNPNPREGDRRDPGDVSWADALLRIAQLGLDALDQDAGVGRAPGERTQVILHLDADRQAPPRLHLGPVLPAAIADYLSCDSTVRCLLVRRGQPLAMGRRQRTVTLRLRPSSTATAAAGCRAVTGLAGCTFTTSSTGPTAGAPTPTTSWRSAPCTIGWCTSGSSASTATPAAPTGSPSPITRDANSDRRHHDHPSPAPPQARPPTTRALRRRSGKTHRENRSTHGGSPGTSAHQGSGPYCGSSGPTSATHRWP
jgi:Domain of unknown function (DUF222)